MVVELIESILWTESHLYTVLQINQNPVQKYSLDMNVWDDYIYEEISNISLYRKNSTPLNFLT
jgi:hypothetical protein